MDIRSRPSVADIKASLSLSLSEETVVDKEIKAKPDAQDLSKVPDHQLWDGLPKKIRSKKKVTYIKNHSDTKLLHKTTQFRLLLYKSWLCVKRMWIKTLIEVLAPILIVTIATIIICSKHNTPTAKSEYKPFQIKDASHAFKECRRFVFLPANNLIKGLIQDIKGALPDDYVFLTVNTTKDLYRESTNDICAGVVFHFDAFQLLTTMDYFPPTINYTIRMPAIHQGSGVRKSVGGFSSQGSQWETNHLYSSELVTGPRNEEDETGGTPGYYDEGFLYLQNLITEGIVRRIYLNVHTKYSGEEEAKRYYRSLVENIQIRLQRFPYPSFKKSYVVRAIQDALPVLIVFSYIVPVMLMVWGASSEKESGIRIQLKAYGVPKSYHRGAWVLRSLLLHIPVVAAITAILSTNWTGATDSVAILKYTNPYVFFLMMVAYVWQTICTSVLIVTFFGTASTATATTCFLWFASYVPYYYVKSSYNRFKLTQRILAAMLGNTGISMGCHLISEGEAAGVGVTWKNMFSDQLSVGWIIVLLVGIGFVEIFIGKYVAKVFPEEGLATLPWNFFLKGWFWKSQPQPDQVETLQLLFNSPSLEDKHPSHFEPEARVRKRKELQIEKVSKFQKDDRILNKVNLNCYEGHLNVIIGDESSGKQELMAIIAGLSPWTKGAINVSRQDLSKNPEVAMSFVGFCPATNMLYPYFTVEETLDFYVQMKGVKDRIQAWDEVERFLVLSKLTHLRHEMVYKLAGSAQRMLMVTSAFIGGSRVVLLNEPTAQMDAAQKQMVWNLVAAQKKHRTVIASMESMNQSDQVVDQIVIMQHGELSTRGSPRFLQTTFGGGYHLKITKGPDFRKDSIVNLVNRRVPGNHLDEADATTLDFFLPEEHSSSFPGLYEDLERNEWSMGIANIHNVFVTMDEIVVNMRKLSMETYYDPENRKAIYLEAEETQVDPNYEPLSGTSYWTTQFKLLFLKNMRCTVRHTMAFWCTSLFPLLCITICGLFFRYKNIQMEPIPFNIDLRAYENASAFVDCQTASYEGAMLCRALHDVLGLSTDTKSQIQDVKGGVNNNVLKYYKKLILLQPDEKKPKIPLIGIQIDSNNFVPRNVEITGYFNNQPLHMSPIVVSVLDNMVLRFVISQLKALYPEFEKSYGNLSSIVHVRNHPLPHTPADVIKFSRDFTSPGFVLGIATCFGYSFLSASFVILPTRERDFTHIQMTAGASSFLFWGSYFLWNFLHFTAVAFANCLILFVSQIPYIKLGEILLFFLLLEVYALTVVLFAGAWTIAPERRWGLAFSRCFLFFILTGPLFMLLLIALSEPSTRTFKTSLQTITGFHNVFLMFPNYSLGIGIFYIFANSIHQKTCPDVEDFDPKKCHNHQIDPTNEFIVGSGDEAMISCCYNNKANDLSIIAYGIGRNIICMVVVALICLSLRIFRDSRYWIKWEMWYGAWRLSKRSMIFPEDAEHTIHDYDVLSEAVKVTSGKYTKDLVIKDLTRATRTARNVANLSVEIDRGDCFCVLGLEGAGKSLTLQVIAGRKLPTSGDITIDGISLTNNYDKYIHQIGYCPEAFPFLKELTGHETLYLIGTLRRIPHKDLEGLITNSALRLLFLHDLHNVISNYNKISGRKLSSAVAMLGNPAVVVFDEPTHSIDFLSRDYLFKSINLLTSQGSIVVVSSHSVAECETICTKMGIMVNGKLRCFGSPAHLRSLFDEGFTVIAKFALRPDKIYFKALKELVLETDTQEIIEEEAEPPQKYFEQDRASLDSEAVQVPPFKFKLREKKRLKKIKGFFDLTEGDEEEEVRETSTWEEDLVPFITYFERSFPGAILVDRQPGFIHYHLKPQFAISSVLFRKLEEAKVVADVEDYYIGQTNLDQVFLNFTRGQRPE